jgi:hypothetical protein
MKAHTAFLLWAVLAGGSAAALAAGSGNSAHDALLGMSAEQRAKSLANGIGHGCVGTSAFPMGVTGSGAAKGFAYWSIRCKGGRSFVVQISPDGKAIATDCQSLQGTGKECFKIF